MERVEVLTKLIWGGCSKKSGVETILEGDSFLYLYSAYKSNMSRIYVVEHDFCVKI